MAKTDKGIVRNRMIAALEQGLHPTILEVIDDSHEHADHFVHEGGAGHEGETHFTIKIVSDAFTGRSRVARHRAINTLLAAELAGPVHALAIDARAPDE